MSIELLVKFKKNSLQLLLNLFNLFLFKDPLVKPKQNVLVPVSLLTFLELKNYSTAEFKLLAQAIHDRISTLRDEDSDTSSHQSSSSINQYPYGTINLQDAQDPFA